MNRKPIFFITGVNGSGKTTLVPLLKSELNRSFVVYDFDERDVPENVNQKWRISTTQHWVNIA